MMETKITTVNERYMEAGHALASSGNRLFDYARSRFQERVVVHSYLDAVHRYGDMLLEAEARMALAFLIEMDCQADRPAEKLTARITDFTLTLTGLVDQMKGNRMQDLAIEIRIKALRSMTRTIQNLLRRLAGDQP